MDDVPHMTPDEFRRCGHAVVERIARYMEEIERYPVLSRVEPGSIRERLPHAAPEHGEPFSDVLRDVDEIVMPGITHWQSPNFFAYFPANASGPSILGDLLSSGLGVQGMLWATSPACTELETHVLDWLVDLLGLPDRFRSTTAGGGVIQDTASSSTLTALLAARERASAGSVNEHGVGGSNGGPDRGPRLAAAADRVHLAPCTLVDREGGEDRGPRAHQSAARRRRRPPRDASGCAGGRDRRRPRGRRDARDGERNGGHHVVGGRRPGTRHRRGLPPRGRLAPRGRRARGQRHHLPGAPRARRRGRARRQLHVQPPQVAAHELRLQLLLGGGSGRADRRPEHPSGVPAQPGDGFRRGHRLPRLARAARAQVPRAEAVVRHPPLRGRGPARARAAQRRPRGLVRGAGGGERRVRARGARLGGTGVLPPPRGRCVQPGADGPAEPLRRSLPHPHQAGRSPRAPPRGRRPGDAARARRGGVGAHRGGGGRISAETPAG